MNATSFHFAFKAGWIAAGHDPNTRAFQLAVLDAWNAYLLTDIDATREAVALCRWFVDLTPDDEGARLLSNAARHLDEGK